MNIKILFAILFLSAFTFLSCEKEIDETPPIITLIGNELMVIYVGTDYTEPGATATDDVDGDISSKIVITHSIDINQIGNYNVKYNVSDEAGNAAEEVIRVVNVFPQP